MPGPLQMPIGKRRARIVARHHLAQTATSAEEVADALVALHATDPATPFLSVFARTGPDRSSKPSEPDARQIANGVTADTERALYLDRSLWRLHAMRRTLFVVPAEHGTRVHAAVGADVAANERAKLIGWMTDQYGPRRGARMMSDGEQVIVDALASTESSTRELVDNHPSLKQPVTVGSGKWRTTSTLASRLLLVLAAEGKIVRTRPVGSWRSSQYRWMGGSHWFAPAGWQDDATADGLPADAWLVDRYLSRFGPVLFDDVRWWTGWTVAKTRRALERLSTVDVVLPGGAIGVDVARECDATHADSAAHDQLGNAVSLLPALDPTAMGWKHRDWYLPSEPAALFDRNGNIGPTVWVAGTIVGAWAQTSDGRVVFELLDRVTSEQAGRIEVAAKELEAALGDDVVIPRFRVPMERRLAAGDDTTVT